MHVGFRSTTMHGLAKLETRVMNCFNAAALASGCTVEYEDDCTSVDLRQCKPLAEQYASNMKELFDVQYETKYHDWSSGAASTDFGDVG